MARKNTRKFPVSSGLEVSRQSQLYYVGNGLSVELPAKANTEMDSASVPWGKLIRPAFELARESKPNRRPS